MDVYQLLAYHTHHNSIQSHSDNPQTPSRHLPDTPEYNTLWPIRGYWEKRTQLKKMRLIRCSSIDFTCIFYQLISHIPPLKPRQYPYSLKQPPNTSQTPYRHPKIWHFKSNTIQGHWEKGNRAINNMFKTDVAPWCYKGSPPQIVAQVFGHCPNSDCTPLPPALKRAHWGTSSRNKVPQTIWARV